MASNNQPDITLQSSSLPIWEQPDEMEDRALMLKQAAEQGYIDNYQGTRIAKTGEKFLIKQVRLWNLRDENGDRCGQAATFPNWQWLP